MEQQYKVFKTTMGRKYRVRMDEDEVQAREIYWLAVVLLPFVTAVLMTWLWIKAV